MLGVFSLWGGLLLLHIPVFICVTDPVNEEEGKALPSLRKSEESSFMFSATNKNTPVRNREEGHLRGPTRLSSEIAPLGSPTRQPEGLTKVLLTSVWCWPCYL